MSFSIIACVGKNNELGKDGGLVFHIKEDMQFFKETTMGHPVLMGLKTFLSLPKALPGRKNYVLTYEPDELPKEVYPVADLEKFISEHESSDEEVFVIGGGFVYSEMLPVSNTIYLTEVNKESDADTFFPDFDKKLYNKTIIKKGSDNGVNYVFAKYTKK